MARMTSHATITVQLQQAVKAANETVAEEDEAAEAMPKPKQLLSSDATASKRAKAKPRASSVMQCKCKGMEISHVTTS